MRLLLAERLEKLLPARLLLPRDVAHGCLLIEGRGFPAHDGQRVLRAPGKARAEPVAIAVRNHRSLAVDDRNGALGAIQHALSAAVAAIPVYFNDVPIFLHGGSLRVFLSVCPSLHPTGARRRDQDHDFPLCRKTA